MISPSYRVLSTGYLRHHQVLSAPWTLCLLLPYQAWLLALLDPFLMVVLSNVYEDPGCDWEMSSPWKQTGLNEAVCDS